MLAGGQALNIDKASKIPYYEALAFLMYQREVATANHKKHEHDKRTGSKQQSSRGLR